LTLDLTPTLHGAPTLLLNTPLLPVVWLGVWTVPFPVPLCLPRPPLPIGPHVHYWATTGPVVFRSLSHVHVSSDWLILALISLVGVAAVNTLSQLYLSV